MSHTVKVKTAFTNREVLKAACEAKNIPFREGQHRIGIFSRNIDTEFSVQLPGWNYPVSIDLKTGEATFDNYNGSWGDIKELGKLRAEYALQVAEREPDVQQLLMEGWQASREKLADRERLVLTYPE